MNPLFVLWTASLLGAGLFFASGYLLARSKRAHLLREQDVLQTEYKALSGANEQTRQRATELEAALRADREQHRQQLAVARRKFEQVTLANQQYAESLTQSQHTASQLQVQNQNLTRQLQQGPGAAAALARAESRNSELEAALKAETQKGTRAQRKLLHADAERKKLNGQLTALETDLAAAQTETKALQQRAALLASQKNAADSEALRKARAECARLREQLSKTEKAHAQLSELQQELTALRLKVAETLESEKEYQRQLEKRTHDIQHLQHDLSVRISENDSASAKIRRLEAELTTAQSAAERLSSALPSLRNEAAGAYREQVDALEKEVREQQVRNRMLSDRVAELGSYAEQNAALTTERDFLSQELTRLKHLQEFPANGASTSGTGQVRQARRPAPSQSGTTRRVLEDESTLESSLERHLYQLVSREPGITAVLSDDNGFPVVGVGPDATQEGVSVLTSLAQELATRAVEFVDLDVIKQMELVDQSGLALRVRFFTWQDQALALGCLGTSRLQPDLDEEQVVTGFPSILLASSA